MAKQPRTNNRKHVRELLILADELGWELSWTKGSHLVFRKPDRPLVFSAGTPSDPRSVRNLKAQLIRAEVTR